MQHLHGNAQRIHIRQARGNILERARARRREHAPPGAPGARVERLGIEITRTKAQHLTVQHPLRTAGVSVHTRQARAKRRLVRAQKIPGALRFDDVSIHVYPVRAGQDAHQGRTATISA